MYFDLFHYDIVCVDFMLLKMHSLNNNTFSEQSIVFKTPGQSKIRL